MGYTIPHNFNPAPHQLAVLQDPARFKVLVWHRKAWKTTLAINELFRWANAIKGTYWYVAPFLSQAKKIIWQDPEMGAKYCPQQIWDKRNNSETYITFPNGSVVYILGADNPDSLRGPNPRGVILDEFDDMKPEIWSGIIQPIMMASPNSWTWFTGTPKGRRGLFEKHNYALTKIEEAKANGTESEWYVQVLKASKSGIITEANLTEARNSTTEDFYKQEYEVEFLEGAGAFFKGIDACVWDAKLPVDPKKKYQIGMDWAKVNDYTVFTPFDLTTFNVGRQERFNQIDYNLQKARAETFYLRHNKARTIMDGTGVGAPIFDDLSQRIHKLESFVFTEQSRRDLLGNLQILLEQRKIKIPDDEILLNELRSFQYVLGANGKVKVQVPDGVHDDCVMSLALAVWDIPKEPVKHLYNEEREVLKQFDFYQQRKKKFGNLYKR